MTVRAGAVSHADPSQNFVADVGHGAKKILDRVNVEVGGRAHASRVEPLNLSHPHRNTCTYIDNDSINSGPFCDNSDLSHRGIYELYHLDNIDGMLLKYEQIHTRTSRYRS